MVILRERLHYLLWPSRTYNLFNRDENHGVAVDSSRKKELR
jgi:hypothetical protein